MALPWIFYAFIVVCGATGIHFFSKLAKDSADPVYALVITMFSSFVISLCVLPFAEGSLIKTISETRVSLLYVAVGASIIAAQFGIFWMFHAGAPISIATPLVRFAPAIFAVLLGVLFFNENLKVYQILGMVMAASGFLLMTKK